MKKTIMLLLITTLSFAQALKVANITNLPSETVFEYATNRIVVKLTDEAMTKLNPLLFSEGRFGIPAIDQLTARFFVKNVVIQFPKAKEKVYKGKTIKLANWHKLYFSQEIDVDFVVSEFRKLKEFLEVQPVGVHSIIKSSNDPLRDEQWHLDQANDHDIDVESAWELETGNPDIIVAIFDTGVRYFHKDLGGADASYSNPTAAVGNMWINNSDNDFDGVDSDGNGFIDDWIGWDFVSNENVPNGEDGTIPDNDPRDFNGHGTHCSGIVGAINNNGYAVSSPAGGWNNGVQAISGNGVKIMACRIGYTQGPPKLGLGFVGMDYAAEAFYYAADNGANIVSCSWGSSNSGGLDDAIDYFLASGGLIFKAAGNDNNEESDYMLDRSDVIGVASTDTNDVKSDFSTYGTFVDISAPGTAIWSTYHAWDDPENDYVASLSGTSMATPLTAGVAALIWSNYPLWTTEQVKQRLFDTADDIYGIPGNSSYIGKLGVGRVNAHQALLEDEILADIKVMLEGPYNSVNSSMNTNLKDNNVIPLTSPYSEAPRTVTVIPANVVDWVLLELRTSENGPTEYSKSVFLRNDGKLIDDDGTSNVSLNVSEGDYYIVVKHRNHLPIMSSGLVHLPN